MFVCVCVYECVRVREDLLQERLSRSSVLFLVFCRCSEYAKRKVKSEAEGRGVRKKCYDGNIAGPEYKKTNV